MICCLQREEKSCSHKHNQPGGVSVFFNKETKEKERAFLSQYSPVERWEIRGQIKTIKSLRFMAILNLIAIVLAPFLVQWVLR